ncbi:MAG: baseplate protein [Nitrospirae bacterium]|nr:MAG: baseplate protein [Nitrospirota bacterium]
MNGENSQRKLVGNGWAFPLTVNARGGLALAADRSEIEQAIRIILTTIPGQRVMRPTFGCRLYELVFAPINRQTLSKARRYVEEALGMWEPRITVMQIVVTPDPVRDGCLTIEINYRIKSTKDERSLVYPFYIIPEEQREE